MAPDESPSRANRVDGWVRRHPTVVISTLVVFLVGSFGGLWSLGSDIHGWYEARYRWRSSEYAKLSELRSGLAVDRFKAILGEPMLEDLSPNGPKPAKHPWRVLTFAGRDYWVQAAVRQGSPTVGLFAVTTCSKRFRPTFYATGVGQITLNETRVHSYSRYPESMNVQYVIPVSEAPSFYMTTWGSHSSNFKSAGWGVNGACFDALPPGALNGLGRRIGGSGEIALSKLPRKISTAPINTYIEWGPSEREYPRDLYVGIGEVEINIIAGKCAVGCVGHVDPQD